MRTSLHASAISLRSRLILPPATFLLPASTSTNLTTSMPGSRRKIRRLPRPLSISPHTSSVQGTSTTSPGARSLRRHSVSIATISPRSHAAWSPTSSRLKPPAATSTSRPIPALIAGRLPRTSSCVHANGTAATTLKSAWTLVAFVTMPTTFALLSPTCAKARLFQQQATALPSQNLPSTRPHHAHVTQSSQARPHSPSTIQNSADTLRINGSLPSIFSSKPDFATTGIRSSVPRYFHPASPLPGSLTAPATPSFPPDSESFTTRPRSSLSPVLVPEHASISSSTRTAFRLAARFSLLLLPICIPCRSRVSSARAWLLNTNSPPTFI